MHYSKEAYLVVVRQSCVEDVSMYYVMYGEYGELDQQLVCSHAKQNLASAQLNHTKIVH